MFADELDLGDGVSAVPVALVEIVDSLRLAFGVYAFRPGRAVLAGEEDFVGVHIGYSLRYIFLVFSPYSSGVA